MDFFGDTKKKHLSVSSVLCHEAERDTCSLPPVVLCTVYLLNRVSSFCSEQKLRCRFLKIRYAVVDATAGPKTVA